MKKIEGLDTLRFFSFLAIFVFHATPYISYGYLGVDFFFVLSSFLLTYLSLREIEATGDFSKFNFFARRALRIFPLYYLVIIVSFLFLPFIGSYFGLQPSLPQNKILYWFFLSNYETSDSIFYLKFLWSIAVEEQFYLVFIMMSFLLKRSILSFVSILFLCYFGFMFYAIENSLSTYTNVFTHFPNFGFGVLTAYLFYKNIEVKRCVFVTLILSIIGVLMVEGELFENIFISILFASLILLTIYFSKYIKHSIFFKTTEKLGTYTYGLYVYSGIVLTFVSKSLQIDSLLFKFSIEFGILLMLSVLSYHFYEKPFLKLKRYFR